MGRIVKTVDEDTPPVAVDGLTREALLYAITGKEVDITLLVDQLTDTMLPGGWTYCCVSGILHRGKTWTVLYDADGSRYGKGVGLKIFRDE